MGAQIRIHRRLPNSLVYPCSKKDAKQALSALADTSIHFGLKPQFEFDSRCHNQPQLQGSVVASVQVNRELYAMIQFFPIRRSEFSDREHLEFVSGRLPRLHAWITEALAAPETQVIGHRELVVESVVDGFAEHEVTFL